MKNPLAEKDCGGDFYSCYKLQSNDYSRAAAFSV